MNEKPDTSDCIFPKDIQIYETVVYFPQFSIEVGLKRINTYSDVDSTRPESVEKLKDLKIHGGVKIIYQKIKA